MNDQVLFILVALAVFLFVVWAFLDRVGNAPSSCKRVPDCGCEQCCSVREFMVETVRLSLPFEDLTAEGADELLDRIDTRGRG